MGKMIYHIKIRFVDIFARSNTSFYSVKYTYPCFLFFHEIHIPILCNLIVFTLASVVFFSFWLEAFLLLKELKSGVGHFFKNLSFTSPSFAYTWNKRNVV